MKAFNFFVFVGCFLSAANAPAQTPKAIEADLLKSFKKIDYWVEYIAQQRDTTDAAAEKVVRAEDSLENANEIFAKKLKDYTLKYPATINQNFSLLKNERLDIFTSADGLFRIYSWDTWLGGTMHDFANIFQYKVDGKTESVYEHTTGDDSQKYTPFYSNLYTFKVGPKTYYLGVYGCIYSSKDIGTGIQVFAIENGKLNNDIKIIKTASGMHSKIYYDFDFFSVVDIAYIKRPTIYFDAATQTIHVPVVSDSGKITRKYITYKFTGKYFEKVK